MAAVAVTTTTLLVCKMEVGVCKMEVGVCRIQATDAAVGRGARVRRAHGWERARLVAV